MQNKIIFLLCAVVIMQLIYFLVKSTKDRFKSGNTFLKGSEYIRAYIAIAILVILLIFTIL